MSQRNVKTKGIMGLEARITALEERVATLEQVSQKFTRKKTKYTDEQRAAIRARLLAGQEAARKSREAEVKAGIIDKPQASRVEKPSKNIRTDKSKKVDHMSTFELS